MKHVFEPCTYSQLLFSQSFRSSRPDAFCEKGVLRDFAKFTGNTCARVSFLIKLQAPLATLLKKILWHRCFPVNFGKFLRTSFFTEHLQRLLLEFRNLCINVLAFNWHLLCNNVLMVFVSISLIWLGAIQLPELFGFSFQSYSKFIKQNFERRGRKGKGQCCFINKQF